MPFHCMFLCSMCVPQWFYHQWFYHQRAACAVKGGAASALSELTVGGYYQDPFSPICATPATHTPLRITEIMERLCYF